MYGSNIGYSDWEHAILTVHYWREDKGDTEIEVFTLVTTDELGHGIFESIESDVKEYLDENKVKENEFYTLYASARYHTSDSYYQGIEVDVEYGDIKVIKNIKDYKEVVQKIRNN